MLRGASIAVGLAAFGLCAGPAAAQPTGVTPPSIGRPPAAAACAPPTLFRTTVRNISPGLAASDRAAQPRTIWRLGAKFMRNEEGVDPVSGVQSLVIVAEPDVWVINEADRTGRHSLDPGPEFAVHAPILPLGAPPQLLQLEFGCESDFLAAFAPEPEREMAWGPVRAGLHRVVVGDHMVVLLMDLARKAPLLVSYVRQGRPTLVFRYDDYSHGLPERPGLFAPDADVEITEGPAGPPPDPAPAKRPRSRS